MSTADSQLHAVSALITRDWYRDIASNHSDQKETRIAQYVVPILGIIAYIIAIQDVGFIVNVTSVSISGSAQLFPILVGVLYWKRSSATGALVGFISGILTTSALTFGVISLPSLFPRFASGFYGLIVTTALFVSVSLFTNSIPDENYNQIHGYIDYAANQQWKQESTSTDD